MNSSVDRDLPGVAVPLVAPSRVLLGLTILLLTPVAAAQEAQRRSTYERNTEPIALLTAHLGSFSPPISSKNPEALAYFDQGFRMMYAFPKPEAIRSFREAWKCDPVCDLLLGRGLGLGFVPERPDVRRGGAACLRRHPESALHEATSHREGAAFIDAMAVRYVETSIRTGAWSRIAPTPKPWRDARRPRLRETDERLVVPRC